MDIDDVLVCLSQIDMTDLHKTIHFGKRVNQRKDNIQLKLNSIDETIINEKPVCISKQDDTKFRLCYELDKNYGLIIVLNIKTPKPLIINLVTCYKEDSKKRRR